MSPDPRPPAHAEVAPAQYKMASRSAALGSLYRALLGVLMPTFAWVAPRWNRRFMRAVGRSLAFTFWKLRPKYERAVCRNIAQATGRDAGDPEVRRLAYRMHYHHAYFWIDMMAFSNADPEDVEAIVSYIRGEEHVNAAREAGKGVILATAHVGNWELGGILLGKRNIPVTIVYSRDRFEAIEDFRSLARTRGRVKEVAVSDSLLSAVPLVHALRQGEIVALQADRDWNDKGLAVPFFGKPAFFPKGPAILAQVTGAPIVFCLILHEEGLRYGIEFFPPVTLASTGDREGDVTENVGRIAAQVESMVRAHVDQWYCYYPLWEDAERRLAGPALGVPEPVAP